MKSWIKSELVRQYCCCWITIDRRLNSKKYQREKKKRIYTSKLDEFKNIIDEKIENQNIPSTGIYFLLKNKYGYTGKYGIINKYIKSKKENIISNLTVRFKTIKGYQPPKKKKKFFKKQK